MFGDRENGFPFRVYSFLLIISWLLEPTKTIRTTNKRSNPFIRLPAIAPGALGLWPSPHLLQFSCSGSVGARAGSQYPCNEESLILRALFTAPFHFSSSRQTVLLCAYDLNL